MRRRGGFRHLLGRRNRSRGRLLCGLVVAALFALFATSRFLGPGDSNSFPPVLAPEVPVEVHTLPAHDAFLAPEPTPDLADAHGDAPADAQAYDRDGAGSPERPLAADGHVPQRNVRDAVESAEPAVTVSVVVAMREGENVAAALHSVCRGASLPLEVIVVHDHAIREEQHHALQAAVARFPLKVLSVAPVRHHGAIVSLWSMLNHGAEAAAAASHSLLFLGGALQPRDADFVDRLVAVLQSSPDAGLVGCTTLLRPRDMAPAAGTTTAAPTQRPEGPHGSSNGDADAARAAEEEEAEMERDPAVIGQKGYSVRASVHGTRVTVAKRLAGFTERDPRGQGCDTVDLPSLSCLAVPRKLFYDAGGLAPVETLGDMAVAGRLGHDAKRDIGRALVAAIHAAEDALDQLSAGDRRHMQEYVGLCMDAVLRAREVATKAHIALGRDASSVGGGTPRTARRHADVVTDEQLDALCREVRNSAADLSEVIGRSLGAVDTPALDLVRFAESKGLVAKACGVMALERFDWLPASLRQGRREYDGVSFVLDPADGITDSTVAYFREKLPGGPRHLAALAAAKHEGGEQVQGGAAPLRVVWDAFCCGCCGFSNEIVHFVQPLQDLFDVALIPKPECFCSGFPSAIADTLARLQSTPDDFVVRRDAADEVVVWVSHTDPMSYRNRVFERRRPDYLVGRSMYEFTRIDAEWAAAANADADEIWVPAGWVRSMFVASGVNESKLVVVPEAVDTAFFDPAAHGVIALPPGADPTAPAAKWRHWCNRDEAPAQAYKFHSSFKWEPRKGWDVLFEAYHRAFKRDDAVSLYVHTHIWFSGGPETYGDARNVSYLRGAVEAFVVDTLGLASLADLPHFCLIAEDLAEREVAELYNAADAFVLPTRGEGWGLPIIEAMAMGKPAIATAWGGQLEFMTPDTAFLIPVTAVEELEGPGSVYRPRPGKKWAQPSIAATARLMRLVFDHPDKARAVGKRARQRIERDFSEAAVRDVVAARLRTIRTIVLERRHAQAGR
jgi:glycosyltransferase involved in cell wall biosynthesis